MISQNLIKINIGYLTMENNKIIEQMRDNAASIATNIDPSLYKNIQAQLSYKELSGEPAVYTPLDEAARVARKNKTLNAQFKENRLEVRLYLDKLDTFDV